MRGPSILLAATLTAPFAVNAKFLTPRSDISNLQDIIDTSCGLLRIIDLTLTASGVNRHLDILEPKNQSDVTNLFLNQMQADANYTQHVNGALTPINGTWALASQICFPATTAARMRGANRTTIQLLVHGGGIDSSYWDIDAPGYSYIEYAAEQGYPTFSFDRLGSGKSDHPDPIKIVQPGLHVAIVHELVNKLRSGGISNRTFGHVVGVGHSLGSAILTGLTTQYPKDLDAAVLTGFAPSPGASTALALIGPTIASQADPLRFHDLSNGYLASGSLVGSEFFFFRQPGYDPALLRLAERTKGTLTIGEAFSAMGGGGVNNYSGPIDVVIGEKDLPICGGDCGKPYNKAAATRAVLFPKSMANGNGSDWYIAPGSGHALNYHYAAGGAYEHIHAFMGKHRL